MDSMDTVDRFIYYSELVGNTNTIKSKTELESLLDSDEEFGYVNLSSFNKLKEIIVDEKGIKKSIVEADLAIAETGTIVINNKSELLRRATSLSEELCIVIPKSKIVDTIEDTENFMHSLTEEESAYITFITGASRTADIELILAMGVHGPLKVNVFIILDM
jgi:L-lactate dehydrogenase complex protein LldG